MAARYLARAVALPPSNTSWYMGLSNGAAGLCKSPYLPCPAFSPSTLVSGLLTLSHLIKVTAYSCS